MEREKAKGEREVRGEVREMSEREMASYTSAFWQSFDLSPLQCALTHKAASPPVLAVISPTDQDNLGLTAVDPSGHREHTLTQTGDPVTTLLLLFPTSSHVITRRPHRPNTRLDMTDDCRRESNHD